MSQGLIARVSTSDLPREEVNRVLKFGSVMVGTLQHEALVTFYEKVFEKPADMADQENGFAGWQVEGGFFGVLKHSEMGGKTKDPGRIMLNFETTEVAKEFERLKSLGAVVVREPYAIGEGLLATLADPDGNYFQLVTPM